MGERKTLRVVAELADVWNAPGCEPDEFGRLSTILDRHCVEVGRDPQEIRRSVQFRFEGDVDATVDVARAYVAQGVDDLVLVLMGGRDEHVEQAYQVASLLPALRALR
jgi:alkanesulfonate monooxygenase SsuD/methylene tetrahydromethanopterin reductase-like flavin-dependent oxidoreductase (luciferase family)